MEDKNKKAISYSILRITAVLTALCIIIYFGRLVFISFTNKNGLVKPNFIGLDNYSRMIRHDDIFFIALKNTAFLYFMCALIVGIISLIIFKITSKLKNEIYYIVLALLLVFSIVVMCGGLDERLKDIDNLLILALIYVCLSLFGIILSLISLFCGRIFKGVFKANNYLLTFLAFSLPIIIIPFIDWNITRITGFPSVDYLAHTLIAHAKDYGAIRFEIGYASAISVINCLVIALFVFIIFIITYAAHMRNNKSSKTHY